MDATTITVTTTSTPPTALPPSNLGRTKEGYLWTCPPQQQNQDDTNNLNPNNNNKENGHHTNSPSTTTPSSSSSSSSSSPSNFQYGIFSESVISPQSYDSGKRADVIIIGAGYAGLIAARECVQAGMSVLLLEGRDRIGGRTLTAMVDGQPYELGGSWIHHSQPYIWTEITRYGLQDKIGLTLDSSVPESSFCCIRFGPSLKTKLPRVKEDEAFGNAFKTFANVDGAYGRRVLPNPYQFFPDNMTSEEVHYWTNLTCLERYKQVESHLSNVERSILRAMFSCLGTTLENVSFWQFLRTWALAGYNDESYFNATSNQKLCQGQSRLCRLIFEDIVELAKPNNLFSYYFNVKVDKLDAQQGIVSAIPTTTTTTATSSTTTMSPSSSSSSLAQDPLIYSAKYIISTIPYSVLGSVQITPPFDNEKISIIQNIQFSDATKLNIQVKDSKWRSWVGVDSQGPIGFSAADDNPNEYTTSIVSFGPSPASRTQDHDYDYSKQPHLVAEHLNACGSNFQVNGFVTHDWTHDEFSKGGCITGYEHDEILRKPHGCIRFASADSALGWKSSIDGACQEGIIQSRHIINDWRKNRN